MIRALLLLAALVLATAAAPFDPFGAAGIDQRPGAAVPLDGRFADAGGRTVTLAGLGAGKPILLVPVLHDCPNFCGVTLDGVARALEAARLVPGRDVAAVAFGIDPREGPGEAAAAIGALRGRHPGLHGAIAATTGDAAAIRRVTDALGYRYAYDPRIGQYAHAAASAVLTPDGHLVRWLYGIDPSAADLRTALADARAGRRGGVVEQLILLCYHYDPATGSYGLAIDRILKTACVATALALGALILWLRRGERRRAPC